ncbi:MAG: hypothetical protein KatS3mg068_1518 [Candidatus Sericytochromatia bacterium]|nr:MAG: hypothetical protein KatS3mg068_1518 [Candidatus Sericytochromatia bacterium]
MKISNYYKEKIKELNENLGKAVKKSVKKLKKSVNNTNENIVKEENKKDVNNKSRKKSVSKKITKKTGKKASKKSSKKSSNKNNVDYSNKEKSISRIKTINCSKSIKMSLPNYSSVGLSYSVSMDISETDNPDEKRAELSNIIDGYLDSEFDKVIDYYKEKIKKIDEIIQEYNVKLSELGRVESEVKFLEKQESIREDDET